MNYRSSVINHRLSVVKLGLSLLALAICATVVPAQTKRPNILWISTEDISPDLGCYGDPYAVTPNIDRLAAQGVRYTNAFATAPVCAPSRSAIITGMYPTTIGSMHMRSKAVPPAGVKAFTEYLRAAGYYCTNNSKTDYNFEPPPQPGASGMRAFNPPPPDTLWDESSNTAHWRNRADKSQPFFAVFNITVTHESQVRAPVEQYKRNTARLKPEQFHDPAKAALPPYYPDTPLVRKDWARYYDNITAMDYLVADLLKELEEDGLAENTVVFFWGDHGRGLPRSKRFVYDSGLRVPLIVRWPGQIQPGTTNDELVCLFDLGPTALSLADAPIPAYMQAQAILGPQKKSPRQFAFAHRDRMDEAYDMSRSVMGKQFHYIRNFHPDRPYFQYLDYLEEMPTMMEWRRLYKDHMNALDLNYGKALNPAQLLFIGPSKPPEELYDVKADPHEIHNLADDPQHQATLKQMRAALDKWQKDTKDLGSVPELELRERMRPGGVWQQVVAPRLSQTANGDTVKVKLSCATEGSSIAYTTDGGAKPHWLLYIDELTLKRGATLRFKACRLGYLDSQEGVEKF
jgi:N-sulfoglucosamine sulfohydrolase